MRCEMNERLEKKRKIHTACPQHKITNNNYPTRQERSRAPISVSCCRINDVREGGYRWFGRSLLQGVFQEYSIRIRHVRIVRRSGVQLLDNFLTYVDDSRSLLRRQCRSNVGAQELIPTHVRPKQKG